MAPQAEKSNNCTAFQEKKRPTDHAERKGKGRSVCTRERGSGEESFELSTESPRIQMDAKQKKPLSKRGYGTKKASGVSQRKTFKKQGKKKKCFR